MTIAESLAERVEAIERRIAPGAVAARQEAARREALRAEAEERFGAEVPGRRETAARYVKAAAELRRTLEQAARQDAEIRSLVERDEHAFYAQKRAVELVGLDHDVPAPLPPVALDVAALIYQVQESLALARRYGVVERPKE